MGGCHLTTMLATPNSSTRSTDQALNVFCPNIANIIGTTFLYQVKLLHYSAQILLLICKHGRKTDSQVGLVDERDLDYCLSQEKTTQDLIDGGNL